MDTGFPDNLIIGVDNYQNVTSPLKPESTVLLKKVGQAIPPDESICQEAHRLVNGERDQTYGTVLTNFTRIAKLWSVVLGIEVTPEQVGLCMTMLKLARELNKHKRDNLTDACGYLLCTQKAIEQKVEKF